MKQKKNKLFTLLFSFIPGAAEMYTGFMKNGTSIMAVFFLAILVPVYLKLHTVFLLPALLCWFYSFFHARNLVRYDDTAIAEMRDIPIWADSEKTSAKSVVELIPMKWMPAILIVLGAAILWSCVTDIIPYTENNYYLHKLMDNLPQAVIAVFLIAAGIRMRKKYKPEITEDTQDDDELPTITAVPAEESFSAETVQPAEETGAAEETAPAEDPTEIPGASSEEAVQEPLEDTEKPEEDTVPDLAEAQNKESKE